MSLELILPVMSLKNHFKIRIILPIALQTKMSIQSKSMNNKLIYKTIQTDTSSLGGMGDFEYGRTLTVDEITEACFSLGITQKDLIEKTPESFGGPGIHKAVQNLRYKTYLVRHKSKNSLLLL